MKTTITIISLSALLAGLTLLAQEPPRPAAGAGLADRFKQFDKNSDGKLNAEEFPVAQFKQMAKDGDGFVTLEEIKAFYASGRQQQSGPAQNPAALQAGGVPMKMFLDLPYAKFEGVEPKLTSLDIYAPPGATSAPILLWVHGGGPEKGPEKGPGTVVLPSCRAHSRLVEPGYDATTATRPTRFRISSCSQST